MKILLVNSNNDVIHLSHSSNFITPPIGLSFISYPLKKLGYNVDFFDGSISKNPNIDFNQKLDNSSPDLVGFSIRNTDNQSMLNPYTSLPDINKMVTNVVNRNIISVLGGAGYSVFPKKILNNMNADYGICDQGENSLPELVKVICNGTNLFDNIPGLYYRRGNKIVSNLPDNSGYKNLKPDYELFNFNDYKTKYWSASIVIKTGCPFNCSFCDTPRLSNKFISRDHEEIIEEIKFLKKVKNIKSFYLIDNCFTSPIDYAKELLYKIIKADININIFAQISSRKNCFDNELFELYNKAGGSSTIIGADSFSETMLSNYNNRNNTNNIYKCAKLAEKYKVWADFCWLVGGPGENINTIKESINFVKKIKYHNLLTMYGIRILPGSPMRQTAINEGIISKKTDLLPATFYFSKLISPNYARKYIENNLSITNN